jgi:IS30 family transposase
MSKPNWKRGPMPLTAKRDLYVQLMSQGMRNSAACRQVAVNRKTGQRWRLGRVVKDPQHGEYRYDPIVALGPKPPASDRYLSDQERIVIADGVRAGRTKRSIAVELGRSVSTVCREVLRNAEASGEYRPHAAQQRMLTRRPRPKQRRVAVNAELRGLVQDRLDKRWSPEQISNSLRVERPDRPDLRLAPESIYQAIYEPSSVLRTSPRVALRTGRLNRQRRRHGERRSRFVVPMTPIKERPPQVEDRVEGGHWEGDLITGTMNQSAIGTLVERSSRFTILVHFVGTHDAEQLRDSMTEIFNGFPESVRRSLTWDQGIEMARHHEFTASTMMPVYFCEPRSPWQRGTNENTNGLLRQYFPKSTDLSVYTAAHLDHVANELNARPRKTLGWRTPTAVFASLQNSTV